MKQERFYKLNKSITWPDIKGNEIEHKQGEIIELLDVFPKIDCYDTYYKFKIGEDTYFANEKDFNYNTDEAQHE